ncbi:MAG: transcription antitermination factor NusB, partial [Vulcanimicrobiaceae bacterium]
MTRRYARELALQTLYSIELGRHEPSAALEPVLARTDLAEHRLFVRELVLGTLAHSEEADAVIAPLLRGWTLDRLPVLDRLLMRMAIYEMRAGEG